jgi:hypothetical protein
MLCGDTFTRPEKWWRRRDARVAPDHGAQAGRREVHLYRHADARPPRPIPKDQDPAAVHAGLPPLAGNIRPVLRCVLLLVRLSRRAQPFPAIPPCSWAHRAPIIPQAIAACGPAYFSALRVSIGSSRPA